MIYDVTDKKIIMYFVNIVQQLCKVKQSIEVIVLFLFILLF